MKIDKILFACSEPAEYSSFWNMQSKLWKVGMGIEPVCLLFGKRANTDMTEEFGKVIEMDWIPGRENRCGERREGDRDIDLPWITQLTWMKFHYPTTEPGTTWLMGDMDLLPLNRHFFTGAIAGVPDDAIAHLNAGGISQARLAYMDGFLREGPQRVCRDEGKKKPGSDLPAHYWAMKGHQFEIFTQGRPFVQQVEYIIQSDRYGLKPMTDEPWPANARDNNAFWYFWCAEENYSSELLWHALKAGRAKFYPVYYSNSNNTQRIGRDGWIEATREYGYNAERVVNGTIIDVHACRPYARQQASFERMVELSGLLRGR